MGIYDRDYYRREGPSYFDSLWPSGIVCKWLIGLNVVVFIFQLLTFDQTQGRNWDQGVTSWFALKTDLVLDGQVWRLLTSAFLHDPTSWMHILFNMVILWFFGSKLESRYGQREFLTFYLVSAMMSGLVFELWALANGEPAVAVGASGAVTAVFVLYAFHFPHQLVYVFFFLPVPVWLLAILQVGQDSWYFLGGMRSPVAVPAHLGGAAFAALYYQGGWRLTGLFSGWKAWRRRRERSHLRLFRPETEIKETVAVAAPSLAGLDEHLEAKVDAVLEKVSRHGQGSLTDNERQVLLKASEIYRRKRT